VENFLGAERKRMQNEGDERNRQDGRGDKRILGKDLFLFLLDHEVKRARRYQNFMSLLLLNLIPCSREDEKNFDACYQILKNVLMEELRETDILGSLGENRLVALLPYADVMAGGCAKSRFETNLKYYDFTSKGYEVTVRQYCFPKNGTDTLDLIKKALGEGLS
jgi:hypothetical protein